MLKPIFDKVCSRVFFCKLMRQMIDLSLDQNGRQFFDHIWCVLQNFISQHERLLQI